MKSIEQCKAETRLPMTGQKVKTLPTKEDSYFTVNHRYILGRKKTVGTYIDFVPGTGGDWWWIEHADGSCAVYDSTEVTDL